MRLLWCESSSDRLLPGSNLHTQGVARSRRLPAALAPRVLDPSALAEGQEGSCDLRHRVALISSFVDLGISAPRRTAASPQRLGRVRGSPKCRKTPVSLNQVIAAIAFPASVTTIIP